MATLRTSDLSTGITLYEYMYLPQCRETIQYPFVCVLCKKPIFTIYVSMHEYEPYYRYEYKGFFLNCE